MEIGNFAKFQINGGRGMCGVGERRQLFTELAYELCVLYTL